MKTVAGKGSRSRPTDGERYRANYDLIRKKARLVPEGYVLGAPRQVGTFKKMKTHWECLRCAHANLMRRTKCVNCGRMADAGDC